MAIRKGDESGAPGAPGHGSCLRKSAALLAMAAAILALESSRATPSRASATRAHRAFADVTRARVDPGGSAARAAARRADFFSSRANSRSSCLTVMGAPLPALARPWQSGATVPPDDPRPPLDPDEIRARIDRLVEKLLAELRAIDREAGEKRAAALARSGLPAEFLESVLGASEESTLTPNEPYATIASMSTSFVAEPRKPGRPLGAGPVAKAAKKLGLSMPKLAKAIGVNENTVKAWNARNAIPDDGQVKIDALLAKAKRDASR